MREKKNGNETVPTEVETSAVATETAEVPTEAVKAEAAETTDTTIPSPIEIEVVAETPKPPITPQGTVVETVQRKTPPDQRRYKLIRMPSIQPKGQQRIIVLHLLNEARKAGKPDISAEEMVPDADKLNYFAQAGTLASIRWHLHQMKLAGQVALTNETYSAVVERGVTPAEAIPPTKEQIAAQIASLTEQLNKL